MISPIHISLRPLPADWGTLSGGDWLWLLSRHPQYAEHCDWSLLTGSQWTELLTAQPQFADQFATHSSRLLGYDWLWVLQDHPQFKPLCRWQPGADSSLGDPHYESMLLSLLA